jgi:hypothetical protein
MPVSDVFQPRIVAKLRQLYGAGAEEVLQGIDELADRYASLRERPDQRLYRRMLAVRVAQPAFHPDAPQAVLETDHQSLVALMRTSLDGNQQILVLVNVGEQSINVDVEKFGEVEAEADLLSGSLVENRKYEVRPHDIAWLA